MTKYAILMTTLIDTDGAQRAERSYATLDTVHYEVITGLSEHHKAMLHIDTDKRILTSCYDFANHLRGLIVSHYSTREISKISKDHRIMYSVVQV